MNQNLSDSVSQSFISIRGKIGDTLFRNLFCFGRSVKLRRFISSNLISKIPKTFRQLLGIIGYSKSVLLLINSILTDNTTFILGILDFLRVQGACLSTYTLISDINSNVSFKALSIS